MDEKLSLILTIFFLSCTAIFFLSLSVGKILRSFQPYKLTLSFEYGVCDRVVCEEVKGTKGGSRQHHRRSIGRRNYNQVVDAA